MATLVQNKKANWKIVVDSAFPGNQKIKFGHPNVVISAGAPDFAAKVGTLCVNVTSYSSSTKLADCYICTVAAGTWVKLNA